MMLLLGMKITHDGGIALIDDNRLVFSIEMEKLDNGSRYAELGDLRNVGEILRGYGVKPDDLDTVAVDGWGYGTVRTSLDGEDLEARVAPYREAALGDNSMLPHRFSGLRLSSGAAEHDYVSFHHTTGHVCSAYCASPFAAAGEPSYVLVWDGGVLPRGYYVRPEPPYVENLGPVFGLMGNTYAVLAMHFEPFLTADPYLIEAPGGAQARGEYNHRRLSVPGKVMAYTALGSVRPDLSAAFDAVYDSLDVSYDKPRPYVKRFVDGVLDRVRGRLAGGDLTSADVLATFQQWMGERLVDSLRRMRDRQPDRAANLCFAGGCALNIKWNSAIRRSGVFDRFWVPPFPNDSGSAIGAASAAMLALTGQSRLDWSVYRGPSMGPFVADSHGYHSRPCDVRQLAALLHESNEPVVVLHGRAELGPRALGNRSILAAATDPAMKDTLNRMKRREDYRPVSPICLEHAAPQLFDPGTPDPYMLFDHWTRPQWRDRIPAVVHVDGSARLQTVNAAQNPVVATLLAEYQKLSGVPVLCNTSANFDGRGFFPDIESALRWGRARYVWSDGTLWERPEPAQ
jgi:carbamoyltransferase